MRRGPSTSETKAKVLASLEDKGGLHLEEELVRAAPERGRRDNDVASTRSRLRQASSSGRRSYFKGGTSGMFPAHATTGNSIPRQPAPLRAIRIHAPWE
ncbi:hypothetical protein D7X30_39955 [Corallococcus sp. AB011P]|uniref:hypothetical protein n=1 Tax=Corallococcus sp. AB011P TaxID=2316735 RepID=UPI000EA20349|nr:hypothetical protein [Corallococcus sp. AB011P]RKG49105.1 hypothetical protein D7X30_39955 [Corallococcus sp. AB011P]